MRNKTLKLAVVGDIHVPERGRGWYREFFAAVSQVADVLAICGDLTDSGLPAEAENLASDLEACTVPVIGVLGNHDYHWGKTGEIKEILSAAGVLFLEDQNYEKDGVGFAGVMGFEGGFDRQPKSGFGEVVLETPASETVQAAHLENSLRALETERKVAILHYAPVVDTVRGEPPNLYPLLGSSRMGEILDRCEVDLAFHGHAHYGTYKGRTRTGIPVYNVSYAIMKRISPKRPFALFEV